MKSKKAQIGIGVIITFAIVAIVGLILFQNSAQNVGAALPSTVTATNAQYTGPAIGSVTELTGQELVTLTSVTNRTDGEDIPASNYSVYECVRTSDGVKGICYKTLGDYGVGAVNITYTYYPAGYIDDAGARGVTGIIILLCAVAIAIAVIPKLDDLF